MSAPRVAVIGAGVAGVAAAVSARRQGASVTVFADGPGASAMTSGAVSGPLDRDAAAFSDLLGLWRFDEAPRVVATRAGVLRRVRGADASLLDLSRLVGRRVGVAVVPRPGWDGRAVARALGSDAMAKELGVTFVPVEVELLHDAAEARYPESDFAALVEAGARLSWTVDRVRSVVTKEGVDGLLIGPWLGAKEPVAERLSEAVGVPVGEVTSLPGEAAGRRLDRSLQRLLGDPLRRGAVRVSTDLTVQGERFDAIVLATGGVAGGGIELVRSDPTLVGGAPPHLVATALPSALVAWSADSAAQTATALPSLAWRDGAVLPAAGIVTEKLGVLTTARAPTKGLFAAGDARFGAGTLLAAASDGFRAGRLASA